MRDVSVIFLDTECTLLLNQQGFKTLKTRIKLDCVGGAKVLKTAGGQQCNIVMESSNRNLNPEMGIFLSFFHPYLMKIENSQYRIT